MTIFAVNFGTIGFLATVEPSELQDGMRKALAGELEVLELPGLIAATSDGDELAMNDISFHRLHTGRVAELAYSVEGEQLGEVRCDGLVVATPAGSTGYNLANGGPVLAWGVEGYVVSFIAPHTLTARALVVAPGDVLSVTNRSRDEDIEMTTDGRRVCVLPSEDSMTISFRPGCALLAQLPGASFYHRLREKFGRLAYYLGPQGGDRGGFHRRREQIALGVLAAGPEQEVPLSLRLHALGHDHQAESLREVDDRVDECAGGAGVGRPRTNERSILRMFAGKSPRRASDECPVPNSSMASRIPSAARASISSFSPGRGTIVAVSGHLERERAGLQPALSIKIRDCRRADPLAGVGRDVERHVDVMTGGPPFRRLPARRADDPLAQRTNQPRPLRERDELVRSDCSALGVVPAREGLHGHHPAGRELDHRLAAERQPVVLDRLPEPSRQAQPLLEVACTGLDKRQTSRPASWTSYIAASACLRSVCASAASKGKRAHAHACVMSSWPTPGDLEE